MRAMLLAPLMGVTSLVAAVPTPTPSPQDAPPLETALRVLFGELVVEDAPFNIAPLVADQTGRIEDPPGDAFNYIQGPSDGPPWNDLVGGTGFRIPSSDPMFQPFIDWLLPMCEQPDTGAVCHQTWTRDPFASGVGVWTLQIAGAPGELPPNESAYFAIRGTDGASPTVPASPLQPNSPFTGANNFYRYDMVNRQIQFFLWFEDQFQEFASSAIALPGGDRIAIVVPLSELRMVSWDGIVDHTVAPNYPNGDIFGADASQFFGFVDYGIAAVAPQATPTPDVTPTPEATPTPDATPTPEATATAEPTETAGTPTPATVVATGTAPPLDGTAATTAGIADDDDGGFPWWILIVIAGLLALTAAVVPMMRRRSVALAGPGGAIPINDGPPPTVAPPPPKVGKKAPRELKDFVRCRRDEVLLQPGPLRWFELPFGAPNATFESRPGGGGGVRATATMGTTVVIDARVVDGHMVTEVVDAGMLGEAATDAIRDWTNDLNRFLDHEGKQLDRIELRDGKVHIVKRARAAATKPM